MFEEYAFLGLGPCSVVGEGLHLDFLTPWDGGEAVEQRSDWIMGQLVSSVQKGKNDSLSLAVFAFAVEDMNAQDWVITSASPRAFLSDISSGLLSAERISDTHF